ncbi:hypothetical protein [Arthrobacter castelli]|nr:hypothetical protein [Arthrobacter castelli]
MTIAQMTTDHHAARQAEGTADVVVLEDLCGDDWSSFRCPYCRGPETD